MITRLLTNSDQPALDAFLVKHRDSSMILRSNLRSAGIAYSGKRFEAQYLAAFRGSELVAVAAHAWNGMLILQAPEYAAKLSSFVVALSGRKVTGFLGPGEQVRASRVALGLGDAPTQSANEETLFALELSDLAVPAALVRGAVVCRAPCEGDRVTLCAWRMAYDVETLGASDTAESRKSAADWVDWLILSGSARLATHAEGLLSLSAFNAELPDAVQLGGIFTPPELRGRGYARATIAASLLAARDRGVARAVLFTTNPSAIRCYEALGFQRVGEYGLVLMA